MSSEIEDLLRSKAEEFLETSKDQKQGVLFDNHIGNEQAFNFCEQHGYGFIISPVNISENTRRKLVDATHKRGIWTAYVVLKTKGEFFSHNCDNENEALRVEERVKMKWGEADSLFETDADLFHKLAVEIDHDPENIAKARDEILSCSGGNENPAPIFFLDVLAIVLKLRNAQDAKLRQKARKFYKELLESEKPLSTESTLSPNVLRTEDLAEHNKKVRKGWRTQAYDVEFLRYAKVCNNIILCTKEILLQDVADKMGLQRVQDMAFFS